MQGIESHNNFEKSYYNKVFDNRFGYATKTHRELRRYFEKIIKKSGKRFKKVLEIGCGAGEYSAIISKYAEKIVGIDISNNAIKMANKLKNDFNMSNAEFRCMNFEEINETGFDLILLPNVISHVYDINVLFEKINKILAKNGYIYI